MQRRGTPDTRLAGLAGYVHAHAEVVGEPTRLHDRANAPELDRLQARAARGGALVVACNIGRALDSFIGADRDAGRGCDRGHAVEIIRGDGLLEKIEAGAFHAQTNAIASSVVNL
jgi:hypothetical protein